MKNYPAACGANTTWVFQKKLKKAEKTDFEPLQKTQISFSWKKKYTTILEFFLYKMRPKWTKSVTMTFFSIFSCFSLSLGQGRDQKKKLQSQEYSGNLQAGQFLKYLKKTEQSSCQGSREKRSLVTLITFFFCLIMEKQTTKPALRSLRSLRLGKTKYIMQYEQNACMLWIWLFIIHN
jgi:hypothetical protein